MLNKAFVTYFQHGAAVVQDKMYIYGGNHNGRYLNDIQVSKLSAHTHIWMDSCYIEITCPILSFYFSYC